MAERREIFLRGIMVRDYGTYQLESLDAGSVAALSVGSDRDAPSLLSKGHPQFPNEDAVLLVVEDGVRLAAVADSHFGLEASHEVLDRLRRVSRPLPSAPAELDALVGKLSYPAPDQAGRSATTLLVAVHLAARGGGFGVSYGDSSLTVIDAAGNASRVNEKGRDYVNPFLPGTFESARSRTFSFEAPPGSLLLAYTDGVDECHYGSPETSITSGHLESLFRDVGPSAETFGRRLLELALAGVDGHPGGQDNIALVVLAC